VLEGHVDSGTIVWIGHSRGGEGIVRAYDRIFDGTYTPSNYGLEDIILLVPISPTDFLGFASANPHEANYHLLYGSADGDVEGNPSPGGSKPFSEFERGTGTKHLTYLQGADHNDFNCCGFNDFDGPAGTEIGRTAAQTIAKGYFLVLATRYARGNIPALDYLQRLYEDLWPLGADPDIPVAKEYRDALAMPHFRLDDYQSQASTAVSSSGGTVTFDVDNVDEGRMIDTDNSFAFSAAVPFNGMTRSKNTLDNPQCVVFDWPEIDTRFYELEVTPSERDFSDNGYLSFRACQGTRHPETDALDTPMSFTVTLRDGDGTTSSIDFDEYGRITRTYERIGFGAGAGWGNEFNTVRIRLKDFTHNGTGLDLTNIVAVRFEFGLGFGSRRGRIGLDDVEITVE
jgi:hypothetical protein